MRTAVLALVGFLLAAGTAAANDFNDLSADEQARFEAKYCANNHTNESCAMFFAERVGKIQGQAWACDADLSGMNWRGFSRAEMTMRLVSKNADDYHRAVSYLSFVEGLELGQHMGRKVGCEAALKAWISLLAELP